MDNKDFDHDEGPGLFASGVFWFGLIICLCLLGGLAYWIFSG